MKVILLGILCVQLAQYATLQEVKNSRFYWKTPNYAMPWLKGPNVCAVEEVMGRGRKRYYSECMAYLPRKICGKPTFIRYHCCTGFESLGDDSAGCQGVVPLGDLMDTTKHLYLKDYRKHVKKAGLEPKLRGDGAYTLFAPHNRAFVGLPTDTKKQLNSKKGDSLLLYHMTNDRYYSPDLVNDMTIPSLYPNNATIKINRYSNGIVTANCARVILPNQPATNGLVHVTEKVMKPIQDSESSVMDVLFADPRFGELVTALIVTKLGNELRDGDKPITLFAPTDAAFRNAPPALIERILNDHESLTNLLKYHMVDESICSAAILNPVQQTTKEGQKVNLTCSVDDKLVINGIPVKEADIVTENGVIHVLDEILVPNSAKSLGEVLSELNLERFREYLQQAGASDILDGSAQGNFTLFAPNQAAFDKLTREQKQTLQSQPEAARKVFQYHIAPGKITTKRFVGLKTVASNQGPSAKVRVNVYNQNFGINGAKIVSADHNAGNGVVHVIDKVLFPPEGTSLDKIREDPNLSTFMSLLRTAGMDGLLLQPEGNYTVFAPTNDAFDSAERSYLETLRRDPDKLQMFLNYHLLGRTIYSSAIQPELQYRYKTDAKEWIKVKQEAEREPIIINEEAEIIGQEREATNGAVYVVDQILRCPCITEPANNI